MSRPGGASDERSIVLRATDLTVRYGTQRVVDSVAFDVGEGELVGLIGANGAGKTTTIDAVCGFVAHEGSVVLDGVELAGRRPHQRARAGIGRTWQAVELFDDLTVRQNCLVAARRPGLGGVVRDLLHRPDDPAAVELVDAALDAVGLTADADRRPSELPNGHQKLLGVARALAGSPRVLLLDEPAAGLDPSESRAFGSILRDLVDSTGVGALLVDHDTGLIFDVCDRVVVLDVGQVIAAGPAAEVRRDPVVIDAYLGVPR